MTISERVSTRVRGLPWRDVERPVMLMVWLAGIALTTQALVVYVRMGRLGADSHAYWAAGHRVDDLYALPPPLLDAFNYSPAFAQAVWPLAQLPWPVFCGTWMGLEVAAFLWLLRPLGWRWALPLTMVCAAEWTVGNVVPFIAVAAVLGMRSTKSSAWWAAVALMKPNMALGPIWFAARGEWRKVGYSALVTAAIVGVSYAAWPQAWTDWIDFLVNAAGTQGAGRGLPLRTALAVLLTVVGARLDRRWLLVVAMLVATPVWSGAASATLLAMLPRADKMRAWNSGPSSGTELVTQRTPCRNY